ncbi:ABC transporter ATP-binding protein [Cryobacterium sp. TMS1-20-1]|uniref:ABC transporter ATP-binding protein n=1 Tax=Cryobacterium sp. TMS1-20-1 TaxID=1259223 RepID=UPI00106BCD73|nr:ABC transporter ATP-binding protein [Cryobacterium sp. TMS1-20-1]TFC77248.1 ABC transporter ATP-binding protein [Cryobacterium sp. TMS1-20-1]
MASVDLHSVGLTYPDGTVGLDAIDLRIADGEFVALVGPSGSGKTTLLRTIAGFLAPTTGLIRIGEFVVANATTNVAPERRHLGMVFQQHAVWPHWNVARNIAYPLKLAKVSRVEREERVAAVMQLVGLEGFGTRNPTTLSGGQRQRVALARALVGNPQVLLLDEALSALDEPLRDALRLELQSLTRSIGLTVVHVTHDRDEALALADRVVVLDQGSIQQIASPPELVSYPASASVARFMADATLFEGVVHSAGFTASNHPCAVGPDVLGTRFQFGEEGTLAVLPEDVRLDADIDGAAEVTSSLFGRSGNDVIVDWAGVRVRCRVTGRRPLVGERMTVTIHRALFYPTASLAVREASVR